MGLRLFQKLFSDRKFCRSLSLTFGPLSHSLQKSLHSRLTRWVNRLVLFDFKFSYLQWKYKGFTDLLSRLPSGKTLPPSHYDEDIVVNETRNFLSNADRFKCLNIKSVDRPSVAENSFSIVDSNIPSGDENSSYLIGRDFEISSLTSINLKIIVDIISCIA